MKSSLFVFGLIIILILIGASANATVTQNNTSGSNTSISGGYTSNTTNSYSGGQTNTTTNTTTNSTKTHQIPVNAAIAPSMSSYSQDLCIVGLSGSVQVTGFGVAGGTYVRDQNCERMKLSKLLYDYNMRVASIAILCQDDRVFSAMEHAGTTCPFEGKIAGEAQAQWKKYDIERPDYEKYIEKLKRRAAIDNKKEFVPIDTEYDLYGDDD
jgi:hypothetical protein